MGRVGNALNFPFMVTPCTMNDPTLFFLEPSSCYVMADSSHAIISSTMHFSVYVSIARPVFLMLLELGAVSTSILVESSLWCFHCLPNISLATVITAETAWCLEQWFRADEFVNSSIEFRLYSFGGLPYMAKFFWEFVRGNHHNRVRRIFMGRGISPSLSDTASRPSYIASSVSSSLAVVLSPGCRLDGTSFHGIDLGRERSSFFFILS